MTGIKMTSARRSQLLEQLLKQNEAMLAGGAQSGGEVGLKLLAQFLRQKQMDKLQGEEAAATKTQGARQAAMLNAALEKPATDFQNRQIMDGGQVNDLGRTIQGSQSPQGPADLSALLGQSMGIDPQDPVAGALFEAEIKKAYTPPPPPQPPIVKTFYDGDERVDRQWDPVSGKWVEMGRGKTTGQTINVNPNSPYETKAARDKETARKRTIKNTIGEQGIGLKNIKAHPKATGTPGAVADFANRGGDIPLVGKVIEASTTQWTGLSPEELSRIRTQGETMVAKLVPVITGDDSGRYTDVEQKRTRDIQAQSALWRSADQVLGGVSELQAITIRGEVRLNGQDAIKFLAGEDIDITTEEGIEAWGNWLMSQGGLSEELATEEIKKHLIFIGY